MKAQFSLDPGINLDDSQFSAAGRWWDCSNVRFWRGKAQVIGGWERFVDTQLTGFCRFLLPWTNNDGQNIVGAGTNSNLYVIYGGANYDITPTTFVVGNADGLGGAGWGTGAYGSGLYGEPSTQDTFALTWSLSNYGESMMANPRGQTIFWWQNDENVIAAPLTNAPAEVVYTLVANTRQVMAFGCNEEVSTNFNAMCIRFSDIEDPTDWTTSPSNNAGEIIIEGGSRIVAARLIGEYIYVWTDTSLFLGTFTGDSAQPWRFDKQADHCGLIGPNAAVIVNQVAYWMTPDVQFYTCSLGGAPSLIISPIQAEVKANIAIIQSDKVVASSLTEFGEVRWDYPDVRDDDGALTYSFVTEDHTNDDYIVVNNDVDTDYLAFPVKQAAGIECSRYHVLSTADGSWSKGILSRTYYVDSGPLTYPLAVTPSGVVYYHERGHSADGSAFSWYIESADQYIGDAASPMMMVRGMFPDFKDQIGPINILVTLRNYPQGTERTKGPYSMEPGRNQRAFQASGRVVRIRFYGNSSPTYCRFGNMIFDSIPTGLQ
jgi:hypothetical protein